MVYRRTQLYGGSSYYTACSELSLFRGTARASGVLDVALGCWVFCWASRLSNTTVVGRLLCPLIVLHLLWVPYWPPILQGEAYQVYRSKSFSALKSISLSGTSCDIVVPPSSFSSSLPTQIMNMSSSRESMAASKQRFHLGPSV